MMALSPVFASTLMTERLSGRRPVLSSPGVATHHEEVVPSVHWINGGTGIENAADCIAAHVKDVGEIAQRSAGEDRGHRQDDGDDGGAHSRCQERRPDDPQGIEEQEGPPPRPTPRGSR